MKLNSSVVRTIIFCSGLIFFFTLSCQRGSDIKRNKALQFLKSPDIIQVKEGLAKLATLKDTTQTTVKALTDFIFKSNPPEVQEQALQLLANFPQKKAFYTLRDYVRMENNDPKTRICAVNLLLDHFNDQEVASLIPTLLQKSGESSEAEELILLIRTSPTFNDLLEKDLLLSIIKSEEIVSTLRHRALEELEKGWSDLETGYDWKDVRTELKKIWQTTKEQELKKKISELIKSLG
ncbi:MAG: HEAT repeat domain-containing protein [Candidatus Edwardsbacteria bacterium]